MFLLLLLIWFSQQKCEFKGQSVDASGLVDCEYIVLEDVELSCLGLQKLNLLNYTLSNVVIVCGKLELLTKGEGRLSNVSMQLGYFEAGSLSLSEINGHTCMFVGQQHLSVQGSVSCNAMSLHLSEGNLTMEGVRLRGGSTGCSDEPNGNTLSFLSTWAQGQAHIDIDRVMSLTASSSMLQMYSTLMSNYTVVVVVVRGDFTLHADSQISGSRIGLYSRYMYINGTVNASLGCPQNEGPSRGVSFEYTSRVCAGSGGSSGGYGGVGVNTEGKALDYECKSLMESVMFLWDLKPHNNYNMLYAGSGGGQQNQLNSSGWGGGVIYIGASEVLTLEGVVSADGSGGYSNEVETYGGGGGGGSIKVQVRELHGTGNISARGGDSDPHNYGGEGGGGVIYIDFINYNTQQIPFRGALNVSRGTRTSSYPGTDGIIIYPRCLPGMRLVDLTCVRCQVGYRSFLLNGVCEPCPGVTTINEDVGEQCKYVVCTEFYCEPIEFMTKFVTSVWGVISYLCLYMVIVVGYIIRRLYRLREECHDESLPFDFETATKHMVMLSNTITDELRNSMQFRLVDLLYHVNRVVCLGDNTYLNPWQLPYICSEQVQNLMDEEEWQRFSIKFNEITQWKSWEQVLLYILSFLYYPLYWVVLRNFKKKKWRRVYKYVEITISHQSDLSYVRYKVSKSSDYTLLFLDIFNYRRSDMKYFFLQCPYWLLLSGQGDYLRPYYLCESDPFISCLYYAINRNAIEPSSSDEERSHIMDTLMAHKKRLYNSYRLNKFLSKFNRYSRTIDVGAGAVYFGHRVRELLLLCRQWNMNYFAQFNMTLDLMIQQTLSDGSGYQQITLLQNPDSPKLLVFLTEVYNKLQMNRIDLKIGLFISDNTLDSNDVADVLNQQRFSYHQ